MNLNHEDASYRISSVYFRVWAQNKVLFGADLLAELRAPSLRKVTAFAFRSMSALEEIFEFGLGMTQRGYTLVGLPPRK
jgi:hypothetical protein